MEIVEFTKEWIPQAIILIEKNYVEACDTIGVLPRMTAIPELDTLCENGLGVAAVVDDNLVGFLSAYGPWKPVFCTPDTSGVFSPLHAHAVQQELRSKIWQKLYQAAAKTWVMQGASSHAITLYSHDSIAKESLFLYGFGVRCVDLMRNMTDIEVHTEWSCAEIGNKSQPELNTLRLQLADHLGESPCFMKHDPKLLQEWIMHKERSDTRVFTARKNGRLIAYIDVQKDGENFISSSADTMNICGAYCLPEYRGKGVMQALLQKVIETLKREGYIHLGVDCESFNPCAISFWSKYFQPYTYSVVRRIDENAIK